MGGMIECDGCGHVYDGTAYRWLCPHCHLKASCCEGAPLPVCERPSGAATA
jgi:hypothetical protein